MSRFLGLVERGGHQTSLHIFKTPEKTGLADPLGCVPASSPAASASLTFSFPHVLVFLSPPLCHLSCERLLLPSLLSLSLFSFSLCHFLSLFPPCSSFTS